MSALALLAPRVSPSKHRQQLSNTARWHRIVLIPTPPRLPAEYKTLEARVDALKDVHQKLLKITKVYETESVSVFIPRFVAVASCPSERASTRVRHTALPSRRRGLARCEMRVSVGVFLGWAFFGLALMAAAEASCAAEAFVATMSDAHGGRCSHRQDGPLFPSNSEAQSDRVWPVCSAWSLLFAGTPIPS